MPILLCCLLAMPAQATGTHVTPVSPGARERVTLVDDVCPTFNWAGIEGAQGYELAVFAAPSLPADAAHDHASDLPLRPVLQSRIPGGALGWTPPAGRCLQRGGTYGWVVRAIGPEGVGAWSEPYSFQVGNQPSKEEVRNALEVLRGYLGTAADGPAESVASDSTGESASGPAGQTENREMRPVRLSGLDAGLTSGPYLNLGLTGSGPPPPPPPPPIEFFSVDHTGSVSAPTVRANSLAGDGAAVTNVDAFLFQGLPPHRFTGSTHSHPLNPAGVCQRCRERSFPGCAELCEVNHPTTDALVAKCHVRLFDSGGPSSGYGNGENALLHVCWPNVRPFAFFISSFVSEAGKDFLYVFNGPGVPTNRCTGTDPVPAPGQTLLASLTGPAGASYQYITTGCAALLFCSDGANTDAGWEIGMEPTSGTGLSCL